MYRDRPTHHTIYLIHRGYLANNHGISKYVLIPIYKQIVKISECLFGGLENK